MAVSNNFSRTFSLYNISCRPSIFRSMSSYNDESFQYLERSKLPTMHFQKSLPRLPIPEMDKTCERYLNAQKPVLSDEQYKKTANIVHKFQGGIGKDLNKELIASDKLNSHTSYISDPWFHMYLSARESVVLNFNPFMGFAADPQTSYCDPLVRSTNMLVSSLRMYKSLKENLLTPQVFHLDPSKSDTSMFRNVTRFLPQSISCYGAYLFKAFPLDMSQFKNLFASTRIPEQGKDYIKADPESRHMLVIRNGNYYVFNALDEQGNIYPPAHLMACLKHIISDTRPVSKNALGVLTADNRDNWAAARKHLVSIGNEEQFNKIDSALFCMVFEDENMAHDEIYFLHQMLHGNANNRWFDKSFQLIFEKDGMASINLEHSWGDGVALLRYFEEVFKDSTQQHFVHPDTVVPSIDDCVQVVEFKLDDKARSDIEKAANNYKALVDPLKATAFRYEGLGKALAKKVKLSPDSVIQLAFQMAFFKTYGYFPGVYESCSTAAFKHGRTETMRPLTSATKEFVEAALKSSPESDQQLFTLLTKCSKTHANLVREAAMGKGFDRHLFALRKLAEKKGGSLPEIFTDEAYANLNNHVLSTSTLSSEALGGAAFAPVVPDGFGLGYRVDKDMIGSGITYYDGQRNGEQFKSALIASCDQLKQILNYASNKIN